MSSCKSFRDFEVYPKARALALAVYQMTSQGAFCKDWTLKDQVLRASASIKDNFAEGFERDGTREFIQFIGYAKGSAGELRSQLDSALDRGHITQEEFQKLDAEAECIGRMLKSLMEYLKRSGHSGLKFKPPETQNPKPETKATRPPGRRPAAGAAIISTLLVLTVLTVMVVAFLQSMRIDRLTARAYLNKTRAEMAAQSGADAAVRRLLDADLSTTVNAYELAAINYKGQTVQTPLLTSLTPNETQTSVTSRIYLASSADPAQPPGATPNAELMDINARVGDLTEGWLGLVQEGATPGTFQRRPVPVEWIYVEDGQGRVLGRFAYWMDDESARVDASTAGGVDAAAAAPRPHLRRAGTRPSEVSIHSFMENSVEAEKYLAARQQIPAPLPGLWSFFQSRDPATSTPVSFKPNPVAPSNPAHLHLRAHLTPYAQADERGALGRRRIDLNAWAALKSDFTTAAGRDALALKVVALGDYINEALPAFGNRYYDGGSGGVSASDRRLYCIKLAANIQDYIDQDHQPTVIRQNLSGALTPPDPSLVGEGAPPAPPAAFGKEAIPAIGEYVGWYYNDGGLRIDHTFETWNLHTKAIDLSTLGNVRILLAERNDVTPNTGSTAPDPDLPGEPGNPPLVLTIPPGTVIPPGAHALFTTLPASSPYDSEWTVGSPQKIRLNRAEPAYAYGSGGLRMEGDQFATSADVDTEIVVANEYGYLDIQARVAQQGPVNLRATDPIRRIASQSFGNAGTSSGNNTHRRYPLDSGDPRSFTEVGPSYSEGGGLPSAIAWRRNTANSQSATKLGAHSEGGTYGIIPANTGSAASRVPEPVRTATMGSATDAASVIRDGPMRTIGELGHIYDPAISGPANPSGYPGIRQRGGFRTLSIGSQLGESLGPARLTHVQAASRAHRLLELFSAGTERRGKILLNSALRDDRNLALRAVLDGLRTQVNDLPTEDYAGPRDPAFPGTSATALQVNTDNLINSLRTRQSGGPPFLGLGQMGDLPIFNSGTDLFGSPTTLTPNAENTTMLDRGREEIFRHLAGLLALKGSVYRIHVIGQSGQVDASGRFIVRSTARLIRVVELERAYPAASLDSTTASDLATNNTPTSVTILERGTHWD